MFQCPFPISEARAYLLLIYIGSGSKGHITSWVNSRAFSTSTRSHLGQMESRLNSSISPLSQSFIKAIFIKTFLGTSPAAAGRPCNEHFLLNHGRKRQKCFVYFSVGFPLFLQCFFSLGWPRILECGRKALTDAAAAEFLCSEDIFRWKGVRHI